MDTWINTLPKGLYLRTKCAAGSQIKGEGRDPKMTVTWSRLRFIKELVSFWFYTTLYYSFFHTFSGVCFFLFKVQWLIIPPTSSTLDSLCPRFWRMQIWSVTNDVRPPLTRSSPWLPCVAPQLTSLSSTVITLVGSLRLIIVDFGMHCHSLHLLASHTAWFW